MDLRVVLQLIESQKVLNGKTPRSTGHTWTVDVVTCLLAKVEGRERGTKIVMRRV